MARARRIITVLVVYGIVAAALGPVVEAFERVLVLPAIFESLVRLGLILGVPVVVAVAWRYPNLGGASPPSEDASPQVRGDTRPGS